MNYFSLKLILPLLTLGFIVLPSCDAQKIEQLYEEKIITEEELAECLYEKEEFEARVEELQEKLELLEELTYRVVSDYDDLESEVSDFGYEDWEYNVPDVESASEELYYSIRNLRSEF